MLVFKLIPTLLAWYFKIKFMLFIYGLVLRIAAMLIIAAFCVYLRHAYN